ncbi:hypothetical protein D9757_014229 [Collybiopsis confluens]|uniref:Uncharacterized protein n=1 Tax=Collybiopsis confluens TaxID=2823264 RepID=A0A8H5G1A8_9AGAR|nr:hypothetical protein D9757_014229 [Collybiopsis confluens]
MGITGNNGDEGVVPIANVVTGSSSHSNTPSSSQFDVATTPRTEVAIASSFRSDSATTSYAEVAAVSTNSGTDESSDAEGTNVVPFDFDFEVIDKSSLGASATGSSLVAKNKVHFRYTERVDPIRLVFTACTAKGEDIIIKFGYGRYGLEAHTKAAAAGLAPAVLGFSWIPGGWWIVAMELLDKGFEPCLKSNVNRYCKLVIRSSIHIFHELGFVHGDLRASNVLVRKHGHQWECRLIDFNWAGLAGQVRYPYGVYHTNNMYRPLKYMDKLPITVQHNRWTLDNMLSECKR